MTLDEAIKHCEDKAKEMYATAENNKDISVRKFCRECAEDHEQLAKWLKELKQRRGDANDG